MPGLSLGLGLGLTPSKGGGFFNGLDLDFVRGRYALNSPYRTNPADLPGWSFSRTGAGVAETAAGALVQFASGAPRVTDRGLLVEEARTNLLLNSAFAGGGTPTNWSASGTPTAGASALLPSVSAITFAASASRVWIVQAMSVAAETAYAVAVNVESVTGTIVASQVIGSGLGSGITWPACQANPSGGAGGVVQPGRLVAIITPVGTSEQLRLGAGVNSNQTATVVLSLPQLELGSFPTSPIITTGAPGTRGADIPALTFANSGPATLVVEAEGFNNPIAGIAASVDDGTSNNRFQIGTATGGPVSYGATAGGVAEFFETSAVSGIPSFKAAFRVATNNAAVAINGSIVRTDTTFAVPVTTRLAIGMDRLNVAQFNSVIRRIRIIPGILPDAPFAALTAP